MKNRNVWRVLSLVLALVMMLAVVACTNDQEDPAKTTAGAGTTAAKQTTTAKKTTAKTTAKATAATTAATTGGGSTTEPTDPTVYSGTPDTSWYDATKTEFELTTADQFVGFFDLRNQNTDFAGKTIKLATDVTYIPGTTRDEIAAGTYNWYALNSGYVFKGVFDGQGHTFSGFRFIASGSCVRGMFGAASAGAVVKNFIVKNAYFCSPADQDKECFGMIFSKARQGGDVLIENVSVVDSWFEKGEGRKMSKVGGMVGVVEDDTNLLIKNCYVEASMNYATEGVVEVIGQRVAGFIGHVGGTSTVTFENCISNATIAADNRVAGFVGYTGENVNITLKGCQFTGTLTCDTENMDDYVYSAYEGRVQIVEPTKVTVALTKDNITTTLPAAFANAIKVEGAGCEAGSTADVKTENSKIFLTTEDRLLGQGSANGVIKLIATDTPDIAADGIWHYYVDAKNVLGDANLYTDSWISWAFELTEAGVYNIASYHRLKADNRGGTIVIDGAVVIDFGYTASDLPKVEGGSVPQVCDKYAGAYMDWGVAVELEAGSHTITYLPTSNTSVHWRDFYFVKTADIPAPAPAPAA